MPSHLPGSDFNDKGICHWCQTGFPGYISKGSEKLEEILQQIKDSGKNADCMVGVSGGKDSSYVLRELKQTFDMRVEAFTYSHFGLTPHALENAIIICKELDIKHHIVSLGEDEHLKSFVSFFKVWLKSPRPIPAAMTCVACKHLHLLGSKLAQERNIPALVWAACPMEISPMIPLKYKVKKHHKYKRQGMLKSAIQLMTDTTTSKGLTSAITRHFHTSLWGCLGVTPWSPYLKIRFPNQKQIMFFDYCEWNPLQIRQKLISSTGWKLPESIPDDWHSDCVFNVFKEYMFQKMHGISYTDAFLSNQIRYNIISRKIGLEMLIKSKEYFAKEIYNALDFVGLSAYKKDIDPDCFNLDTKSI